MAVLTPRVLFFSLHRYDHGTFYPGSSDADSSCVGGPGAEGYNINVAWNDAKMGDAEYMAAFHNVLLPVAYEVMTDRWSRWAGKRGRKKEEERGGRGEGRGRGGRRGGRERGGRRGGGRGGGRGEEGEGGGRGGGRGEEGEGGGRGEEGEGEGEGRKERGGRRGEEREGRRGKEEEREEGGGGGIQPCFHVARNPSPPHTHFSKSDEINQNTF